MNTFVLTRALAVAAAVTLLAADAQSRLSLTGSGPNGPIPYSSVHQPGDVLREAFGKTPRVWNDIRSRLEAAGALRTLKADGGPLPGGPVRSRTVAGGSDLVTETIQETWDAGLGQWIKWRRTTVQYGLFDEVVEAVTWYWVASAWVPQFRNRNIYGENLVRIESYEENWDGEAWVPSMMAAYDNNGAGQPLSAIEREWTGTEWADLYRWTFTYDGASRLIEEAREDWVTDSWTNYVRFLYAYNVAHQMTSFEYQIWLVDAWVGMLRSSIAYDVLGHLVLILVQNWAGSEWLDEYRYTYDYGGTNWPIEEIADLWSGVEWVHATRMAWVHDAGGNPLEELEQRWAAAAWLNVWLHLYTYAAGPPPGAASPGPSGEIAADRIEEVTKLWVDTTWENSARTTYVYGPQTGVEDRGRRPRGFSLDDPYPNPFNPATTIGYHLPVRAFVRLGIHDVTGRRVAILTEGDRPAGDHAIEWDARAMPSGVYFCRLQAGGATVVRKLILAR